MSERNRSGRCTPSSGASPGGAATSRARPDDDERGEPDEENVLDVARVVAAQHGQQKAAGACRRSGSAGGSPWTSPTPPTAHLRRRHRCVVRSRCWPRLLLTLGRVLPTFWHRPLLQTPCTGHAPWRCSTGRSYSSRAPREARAERTPSGSPKKAPTSSRWTCANRWTASPTRWRRRRTSTRRSTWSRRPAGGSWPSAATSETSTALQGRGGQRGRRVRSDRLRARQRGHPARRR